MVKKEDFIKKYINHIKKLFEENLPEEDTLFDMCEKANSILLRKTKGCI
jgi:hypothetical protein